MKNHLIQLLTRWRGGPGIRCDKYRYITWLQGIYFAIYPLFTNTISQDMANICFANFLMFCNFLIVSKDKPKYAVQQGFAIFSFTRINKQDFLCYSTLISRESKFFKMKSRVLYCDHHQCDVKANGINPLQSSSIVSCSFCSEFQSPVKGPDCAGSCIFGRDNVRLPLIIITIIHSVSMPMPAPFTCWTPEQSSLVSTQCQVVSTSINSESVSSWLPLPSNKSHLDK